MSFGMPDQRDLADDRANQYCQVDVSAFLYADTCADPISNTSGTIQDQCVGVLGQRATVCGARDYPSRSSAQGAVESTAASRRQHTHDLQRPQPHKLRRSG